jgi:WD40 repeat protein
MTVLGILASVFAFLADRMKPDPESADGGLLGTHTAAVQSVAFDPMSRWLASAGLDGSVYLWNLNGREASVVLKRVPGQEATFTTCMAFAPDGSILASTNSDGSVTLWDTATGNRRHALNFNALGIRCLAFSPDGRLLALGSVDHGIELWDVPTMRWRADLRGRHMRVNAVDFSPDGQVLASASGDGTASLWDVTSGEQIRLIIATANTTWPLVSVAFSASSRSIRRAQTLIGVPNHITEKESRMDACSAHQSLGRPRPNSWALRLGNDESSVIRWTQR